jgi:lipopolysaccharide export system permease protein
VIAQLSEARRRAFDRLRAAGAPPATLSRIVNVESGWRERLSGWWMRQVMKRDPIEQATRGLPWLRTELDLWSLERLGLERRIAGLSVEIHKKFSLPLACVVFVLVGAPLGMRVRRAGPAVAFVSIGFFLFYYLCLVGGEELANRLLLPPWISMWLPNLLLGGWGLFATLRACDLLPRRPPRVARRPAGQPLAAA